MDEPKLMPLKDAIKSAFKNLFDNASLGFLFKSYMALALVGAGVTLAIMIPGVIIFGISGKKPDVPTFSVLPSVSLGEYIVPESSSENLIPISGAQKVIGIDEVSNQSKTAITIYGILAVTIGFCGNSHQYNLCGASTHKNATKKNLVTGKRTSA